MSSFRFFFTLFLQSLLGITTEAQNDPTYLYHVCPNTSTTCPSGSNHISVQSNLNHLFFSLSSNGNATATNGFYSTSSGEHPNMVFASRLCRGDVSTTACQNCVNFAIEDVKQRCPIETEVVIWYAECLLRYSCNPNFFNLIQSPAVYLINTQNDTDQVRFNQVVGTTMNDAAKQAASVAKKFATKQANISGFQTLYSLVQCTPDLSNSDCNRCLIGAIAQLPSCCGGKIGGQVLTPSCSVRYEVYPFYNESAVAAPAPPPSIVTPPVSVINPKENHLLNEGSKPKWIPITASLSSVFGLALLGSFALVIWRRRNFLVKKSRSREVQPLDLRGGNFWNTYSNEDFQGETVGGSPEFPSIRLDVINEATKHFCDANKLGEGGFGPVYKGTLADGKEIAVKRLSRTSGQGLLEFKNEVMLIARLQHRNLVRLLGCCLEDNETLLVYEYMPNKSLDAFLFDSRMSVQLDWHRRFSIIIGIARGILYLHEDSRLRIVHRDLKVSNILLDSEMNPKISDFGMARIFGGNQSEANTNRVVGTYGYMAPEYAMQGLFSIKSDVFSFGVLLLEIISGKKNNGSYFYELGESLLTFAWKLWSKGQGMQLVYPLFVQSCAESEVLKCIHIGLLCVQKSPADRPTMSSVMVMLAGETITLSKPTEPAFFVGQVVAEPTLTPADNIVCSVNEVTLSEVSPR